MRKHSKSIVRTGDLEYLSQKMMTQVALSVSKEDLDKTANKYDL